MWVQHASVLELTRLPFSRDKLPDIFINLCSPIFQYLILYTSKEQRDWVDPEIIVKKFVRLSNIQ